MMTPALYHIPAARAPLPNLSTSTPRQYAFSLMNRGEQRRAALQDIGVGRVEGLRVH